jgi:hypothetical protein
MNFLETALQPETPLKFDEAFPSTNVDLGYRVYLAGKIDSFWSVMLERGRVAVEWKTPKDMYDMLWTRWQNR